MSAAETTEEPGPRWRRDPEAKKVEIMAAARILFSERGYAGTTVRAIAEQAGVNQSLIFRYFGSKQGLYDRCVPRRDYIEALLGESLEAGLRNLVASVYPYEGTERAPVAALLRGATEHDPAGRARQRAMDDLVSGLAQRLPGADASLVAELVLAWVVGIGALRDVVARPMLLEASADTVADLLAAAVHGIGERGAH